MAIKNEGGKRPGLVARLIIGANNYRKRKKNFNISPEKILLLLPRCLQNLECTQNIVKDIHNCKRCGRCPVKSLIELGEHYGVVPRVASGGRLALAMVLESWVEAVVAVACEAELKQGILHCPKPVLAVINQRPNGPCVSTGVDLDQVRAAVTQFLGPDRKAAAPEV